MGVKEYLGCAETAKFVRAALAKSFPGIKFSVKSSTYSGGASISVSYIDGPAITKVERVAKQFKGADFDGMIDLKSYNSHWLLPDGSVTWADIQGTVGSRGCIEGAHYDAPPGAKEVHFGADYIFCNRGYTKAFLEPLAKAVAKKYGKTAPEIKELHSGSAHAVSNWSDPNARIGFNNDTVADYVHREARDTDAQEGAR